ncbi:MAG: hypothetical protein RLY86_4078 [Pseudomonadota bacterium]|jgi:ribose-phosphate pyrophosphokinase
MSDGPSAAPDLLVGFPEGGDLAARLAADLGIPYREVSLHRFPDGESLVRLDAAPRHAVIVRSLDRPNDKLVELHLLAAALRERGAARLHLVAPYLAYMRQDMEFRPGEVVSQRIMGRWLSGLVDSVVTVDPHLHRTHQLEEVFPGLPALALTAAPLAGDWARGQGAGADWVVLGPDEEAETLARTVAAAAGTGWLCGRKERRGDRDVTVSLPEGTDLGGRTVLLVDDVVSSGGTLIDLAREAARVGAGTRGGRILAFTTHAVFPPTMGERFREAGIATIVSADGIPHPSNAISLVPLLSGALRGLF